jgi:hypothetical protein
MTREGTRWSHPGEPIMPVAIIQRGSLVSVTCLVCHRFVHLDARRGTWRHHRYRWTGARKPKVAA